MFCRIQWATILSAAKLVPESPFESLAQAKSSTQQHVPEAEVLQPIMQVGVEWAQADASGADEGAKAELSSGLRCRLQFPEGVPAAMVQDFEAMAGVHLLSVYYEHLLHACGYSSPVLQMPVCEQILKCARATALSINADGS